MSTSDKWDGWEERNYDELNCMWYERGCNYEPDANWDEFVEYEFDIHCGEDIVPTTKSQDVSSQAS